MIHKLAFNKIPLLSEAALDFLYRPEKIREFITNTPTSENFSKAINERKEVNRKILVEELQKQNLNSHPNSKKNIELLAHKNTFTVTTGHQICLFTGPLYSIYKIVSTINLAKKLTEENSNIHVIPVFWMATEDHDFEEINHVNLRGKKVTWNTNQKGPVGRFNTEDITTFLEKITAEIGSDLAKEIAAFYTSSKNLAEAHNKLINHLFGEYGIVVLDADSKNLKNEMAEIFASELLKNNTFEAIEVTSEKLVKQGYKKQVTPREINLFYQEKGLRERIVLEGETYSVLNTSLTFSKEKILEELKNNPEKFSPNVVMRPMYQEKILPNLAYIGGPGELAYWLQLKTAFEINGVPFPILVLRNMGLLIKENISRKIEKLPFALKDYFENEHELEKQYINKMSEISFEDEIQKIEQIFEITKEKASQVDFSLERSVIAELKKAQNSFNKIEKKVTRAEKKNHQIALNQIKSIKNSFFPEGTFQERQSNILEFYNEGIIKNFMDNLKSLEDNLTLIDI